MFRYWSELTDAHACDDIAIRSAMRTLVITESSASSSVRSVASPRTNSSSVNKSFPSCSPPLRRRLLKHLQSCIVLLFGLLLCVLFVAFALCTVENSTHIAGKRILEERKLLRYHERSLMREPDDWSHLPPSQIHVEDLSAINLTPPFSNNETALHGLGSVYMKGTKPMPNLIIANIDESCDLIDYRLFLRTLYRSGTMSSTDLILIFPWPSLPRSFSNILREETYHFSKFRATNIDTPVRSASMDLGDTENILETKKGNHMSVNRRWQTLWGVNPTLQENQRQSMANSYDPDYGSVVGFSMGDLDPADAFLEFLSSPSSQLRRWLCYEMLLGLLRNQFRYVMLVELGAVVVLGDVFARIKRKEFLYLTLEGSRWGDTEFGHDLARQGLSLQGVSKGSMNRFDTKHTARDATKRRSECKKCSKAKLKNRNSLSRAEESQSRLSVKSTDVIGGEHEVGMPRTPEIMVFSGGQRGLMETVYGSNVWNSLEQVERQRGIISSRVILSSMRAAKGLASSMSIEIVRVALQRSSRRSFPDRAVLSYLVQKSPHLLGRRVVDNLQLMENSDSHIHSIENLKPEDVLVRSQDVQNYCVLHARSLNTQRSDIYRNEGKEIMQRNGTASLLILASICASITDASDSYPDCDQDQVQLAQGMLKS